MRQELNLGPCPLRVRAKADAKACKEQAKLFLSQMLRETAQADPPLCMCSCFFRLTKGEGYPYEVHLVYRDQLDFDKAFVSFVIKHIPTTWDKEARATLRKLKNEKRNKQ
jgi:hypothetical protein